MKPEEIAALSQNELRAHNPSLVETIETEARKPLETKVSEMEDAADAVKPTLDLLPQLREILGLKDDADEVSIVSAAVSRLKAEAKTLRESILDGVLAKRFKGGSDADRALVRRVLVGEMTDLKLSGNSEEDEKAVSEMVTTLIDGDESLKKTVSEMESAPPALPETSTDSKSTEWKPGMKTANVRVKSRV